MRTVPQHDDRTPQPHRPQYPPPADLAAIEAAITAWLARHPLP